MTTIRYTESAIQSYIKNKKFKFCDDITKLNPGYVFISYFFLSKRGACCDYDTIEFLNTPFSMSGDYYYFEIQEVEENSLIAKPHESDFTYYINNGEYNKYKHYWETNDYMIRFTTDFKKHPILFTRKYQTILTEWDRFRENIKGR